MFDACEIALCGDGVPIFDHPAKVKGKHLLCVQYGLVDAVANSDAAWQIRKVNSESRAICLLKRLPGSCDDPETLGALLNEIAYAPAMTFVSRPTAGDLMRLAVTRLFEACPASASMAAATKTINKSARR